MYINFCIDIRVIALYIMRIFCEYRVNVNNHVMCELLLVSVKLCILKWIFSNITAKYQSVAKNLYINII